MAHHPRIGHDSTYDTSWVLYVILQVNQQKCAVYSKEQSCKNTKGNPWELLQICIPEHQFLSFQFRQLIVNNYHHCLHSLANVLFSYALSPPLYIIKLKKLLIFKLLRVINIVFIYNLACHLAYGFATTCNTRMKCFRVQTYESFSYHFACNVSKTGPLTTWLARCTKSGNYINGLAYLYR